MLGICLLVSGGLGFETLKWLYGKHKIVGVFTDHKSKPIREFCSERQLKCFVGNPRKKVPELFLADLEPCELVLSVNYLFVVGEPIINYPSKYAINLHGSLLPKYRGRTPHVWAIINGEKETGITAHRMKASVDSGEIVRQVSIPIDPTDTGGTILEKFYDYYPRLIESVLQDVKYNRLSFTPQDENKATYFGKRTPADGQINWDWSKERIYNWIRAQADPYPGAFTSFEGTKIIIHKADFDDHGYHYGQLNGTVLSVKAKEVIVKTPNGAIRLSKLVYEKPVNLAAGMLLT